MLFIHVMAKLNVQQSLMSHIPSEIILVYAAN